MLSKSLSLLVGLALGTTLLPGAANAWWQDDWTVRKQIVIDTGATGAGITDPIGDVPVLVRLHTGNFRFDVAKEDGSDLRAVAGDDKTPLKYHVEKFDPLLGEAFVWVKVPDVKPGARTEFWLYYGNAKAPVAEDTKGTYDPSQVAVYHFAERNQPARDWSAWNNAALTVGLPGDGAMIGDGVRFDGANPPISIAGSPSLTWTDGTALTWSAWVKPAALSPNVALLSRREGSSGLVLGLDNGIPFVEVATASGTQRSAATAPINAGTWTHLALTAEAGQMTVFVNGTAAATFSATVPAMNGVLLLGGDSAPAVPVPAPVVADPAAAVTDPTLATASIPAVPPVVTPAVSFAGFVGDMDEVAFSKVARTPGSLKLAALSQGPDSGKLLTMGLDEETASWISGYFAVILNSVTLDGWVVIGILAVMAVVSWVVMVDKSLYVGRQMKANKKFQKKFRGVIRDLTALDRGDLDEDDETDAASEEDRALRSSSLYRIYHVGVREILGRLKEGSAADVASGEAIASIRASLDGSLVRETQRLNRAMVLLTLAIAGGPFLGLLGTVVGVMITFAAIAASGDVNVNAIAPGIAAALVATVAGLAVAIPALFGYNYLNTKIADATSDMQVFVDEFVTKMAEAYRKRGDARLAAAE